jgi:single-stranded-DNA-specific exonuclease
MSKIYKVKPDLSKKAKNELEHLDPFVAKLLFNRGIQTKKEADKFLNPDFENHLHDPFLLCDMEKAVDRILFAIKNSQKIGIWSDYDADGIPGGALLYDFFKKIGFNNFVNYIPNRHTEGYGMNIENIERLKEEKIELLITIDCGIRDINEVKRANELGIDVIITDHHEQSNGLPEAFAVINPKRTNSKYPEQVLCGTGVVWKLIQAILIKNRSLLKEGQEKWLLDLVGIATLSDMVPLAGENRVLSYYGLSVLKKSRRPGLNKLFQMLQMNKQNLNEDDIAFMITPRINAASRMGHPIDAFNLLIAENDSDAETFARHLDHINNERKGIVASITKEAKKKIKEKILNFGEKPVIVLGNPDWRPSLLGLVANSVAEEYKCPVFLWGKEGGETIKGSCRSDGSTDLVAIMERANGAFLEFGGHKFSGGFSVDFEKIHTLEETIIDACLHSPVLEEDIFVDEEITLSEVNQKTVEKIFSLAPFGIGNEKPVFIFRDVIPEKINRFGKNKEHLSIIFRDGSNTSKAISFFTSPDQFGDLLKEGIKTNLVANIEKSFFNGSSEIRLRIVDFFK